MLPELDEGRYEWHEGRVWRWNPDAVRFIGKLVNCPQCCYFENVLSSLMGFLSLYTLQVHIVLKNIL